MALHQPSGRRRLGFALAATTMLLWGMLPLALKLGLSSLDAVTITWVRVGVASLGLGAGPPGRREPGRGRMGVAGRGGAGSGGQLHCVPGRPRPDQPGKRTGPG